MAKNKNVLKFDGDLSDLMAKFRAAFKTIGAGIERVLSKSLGNSSKGLKGLEDGYDKVGAAAKRAGQAGVEAAAQQDAALEAVEAQIATAKQAYADFDKRLRSFASNMKNGDINQSELSEKGQNAAAAVKAEYASVNLNILRAAEGQEKLTQETKEWLGIVQLADSKLARNSGVRPSQSSGRKNTRQHLKDNDPAKYYGDQVAFQSARIIQDAPFGILGIANNLPGLMQAAKGAREAGATFGQAFRAGLKGPFAAMMAMNLATSLMVGWPKLVKGFKWLKEQFGGLKDLSEDIRKNTIEAVGGQAKFSGGITQAQREHDSARGYLKTLKEQRDEIEAIQVARGLRRQEETGRRGGAIGTPEEAAQLKNLKLWYEEQEKIVEKSGENLAQERAKVDYAMHAEEQEVRDRFLRDQNEALGKSMAEEIKMREELGEDTSSLTDRQFRTENQTRISALREQADAYRETEGEIFQILAESFDNRAKFLEDNEDELARRRAISASKAVSDFQRRIQDMQSETASILGGARVQTFAARRAAAGLTESDSIRDAERELQDFTGTSAQREQLVAETEQRISAISRQAAWERSEINREERENAVTHARAVSDIQLEIREKSMDAVRGVAAQREKVALDHARTVIEISGRLRDEEAKVGDERNEELIAQIRELSDAETDAFDLRVSRMEEEIALQRLRAQEAVTAKGIQIAATREILAFEEGIRGSKGGTFMGIGLRAANMGDTLQQQLGRSSLLERQAIDAARAQYEQGAKSRSDSLRYETDADAIQSAADLELQLKQQLEDQITNIEQTALAERLSLQDQHEASVSDLRTSSMQQTLDAFAGVAKSTVQIWEQNRRSQLAAEGKTQQEINRIVQEEGKKRFRLYKAVAVAETIISTYAAAQKTAEATANLGPILQAAAVAAQLAQGFMRVQQIRATTIGGSTSAGGGSSSSATLGAVATTGASTGSSPAARLSNLPDSASKNALGNTAIGALTLEISRLRNDNASLLTSLGQRPVEVVLESETQARIVKEGQRITQRRTR